MRSLSLRILLYGWTAVLAGSVGQSAFADDEKEGVPADTATTEAKDDVPAPPPAPPRLHWLGGRLGGLVGAVSGTGIEYGYQRKENLVVGLMLGGGMLDMADELNASAGDGYIADKAEITGSLFFVQMRTFFGGSFNAALGLGSRYIALDYDVRTVTGSDRVAGKVEVSSFVSNISIGNVWTWDSGFFLGADWIGITFPFSSTVEASTSTQGRITSEIYSIQSDALDLGKEIGETTSFINLLLTIGGRF